MNQPLQKFEDATKDTLINLSGIYNLLSELYE